MTKEREKEGRMKGNVGADVNVRSLSSCEEEEERREGEKKGAEM